MGDAEKIERNIFEWKADRYGVYPELNVGGLCDLMRFARGEGVKRVEEKAVARLRDLRLLSPKKQGNWDVVSPIAKGWHVGPKLGSEKLYFVSGRDANRFVDLSGQNGLVAERAENYIVPKGLDTLSWREIFVKLSVVPAEDGNAPVGDREFWNAESRMILEKLVQQRVMVKEGWCDPSKVYVVWLPHKEETTRRRFGYEEERGRFVDHYFTEEQYARDFCRIFQDILPVLPARVELLEKH